MLEALGCIVLCIFGMFLFFVGIALESKLKAQASFFRAEAQKALSDAAYTRFQRQHQARSLRPSLRGGLPESMSPSFPAL